TKTLVSTLEAIENKMENIIKDNTSKPLLKSLSNALQNLDIKGLNTNETKVFKAGQSEVQTLSSMKLENIEALKFDDVKVFFASLSENISSLNNSSIKSIFDIIEKILSSLKQPEQSFKEEKVSKDIKTWVSNFEKELSKGDIVFSKAFHAKIDKIMQLAMPSHLLNNKLLEENIQKDIKALLLGIEKELTSNPSLQNNDISKSLDKLLIQVDYFQLLSHLSNATYLYLPYTWEGLENGKFSFKNKDNGSCYCEIDLELKEHGKLNMILQLFDDNQLNINIYTQSPTLKELFKTNMKQLREALLSVQVMPRNINLYELNEKKKKSYAPLEVLNELGFEVNG
ncbi:MAG TPA: flagellar hook-length control protein FliK, partial [Sulfurimonas sp.]|nr:flagellar hook-length control protein FliK [Sulfurimonas sp.]